jgi:predicted TPR repeat methyltransferase
MVTEAIGEYEKATGLDPSNAAAWFDLGFMYKTDHQNDKAIGAFNKYLELNKGKDAAGESRIKDEVSGLGGTPAAAKPAPKKKSSKKR